MDIFITVLIWIGCIIGGIAALLALILGIIGIISLFADRNKVYDKESPFFRWVLTWSTALAAVILRIRMKTAGMEKLPEGRFLLVGNHRSNFDPILTWVVFRKQHIAFISKPENFKVPIYGRIIRKCCFMAIDRENPRNAVKTVSQAVKLLKNDEVSVGVYPEGKRHTGEGLAPFHNMVFKIAQKADVPIVVLLVSGADKIHKNYPFRRSTVRFDILETMSAETVKNMKTNEIGDYIKELMEKAMQNQ